MTNPYKLPWENIFPYLTKQDKGQLIQTSRFFQAALIDNTKLFSDTYLAKFDILSEDLFRQLVIKALKCDLKDLMHSSKFETTVIVYAASLNSDLNKRLGTDFCIGEICCYFIENNRLYFQYEVKEPITYQIIKKTQETYKQYFPELETKLDQNFFFDTDKDKYFELSFDVFAFC